MHDPNKRPPSVWISQIVLAIYAAMMILGLLLILLAPIPTSDMWRLAWGISFAFLTFGGLGCLYLTAFWGLLKRRRWGQWLTVGLFIFMLLSAAISRVVFGVGEGPGGSRLGYVVGMLIIFVPFGFLTYRLAAGDAATNYFEVRNSANQLIDEPPPPPSFDI